MVGMIPVGDIVSLAKVARQLAQYGWKDQLNASKQYNEFGRDVEAFAESLEILVEVIQKADQKLHHFALSPNAELRWDWRSLRQIIGDCEQTLEDCDDLLIRNSKYASGSGPLRNIEWNLLLQADVDSLQRRIQQHTSKLRLALTPFEMDLLSRIRQDVRHMHVDIVNRLDHLHRDLRRIGGVIIPDLEQQMAQQEARQTRFLTVPLNVEFAFDSAFSAKESPSLSDLADIYISYFYQSTLNFEPRTLLARDRVPSPLKYINLLKCIWLLRKINAHEEYRSVTPDSHWPSYIAELGAVLSKECLRFQQELTAPTDLTLTDDLCQIWPTRQRRAAIEEVIKDEMVEEVLVSKVKHADEDSMLNLRLLRLLDPRSNGNEFRISLCDQVTRQDHITLDFDLRKASLKPLYALDFMAPFDIILDTGARIIKLPFMEIEDAMKFQHAICGYRVSNFKQLHVRVQFITQNQDTKQPVPTHNACVQVWIPDQKSGTLTTTLELHETSSTASNQAESARSALSDQESRSWFSRGSQVRDSTSAFPGNSISSSNRRQPVMSSIFSRGPGGAGLMRNTFIEEERPRANSRQSESRSGRLSAMSGESFTSSHTRHRSDSSLSTVRPSIFSSSGSSSVSRRSDHLSIIDIGSGNKGFLRLPPSKPMLVIFIEDKHTYVRSTAIIELPSTSAMPEKCDCQRRGSKGKNCLHVSLGRGDGYESKVLAARRFEPRSTSQTDWDLSRLALSRLDDPEVKGIIWKDLLRISLSFLTAKDKETFSGYLCDCPNRGKLETGEARRQCVIKGHRGLIGKAKEYYLVKRMGYEGWQDSRKHVVNGIKEEFE